MTVGALWEIFEYSVDSLSASDMQKDTVVTSISSTLLDPTRSNKTVVISDISDVALIHSDGSEQ